MNTEELISVAAQAIENKSFSLKKSYHLCHFANCLGCRPVGHCREKHPIFYSFSSDTTKNGFTQKQWYFIGEKLKKYYKEASPCIPPIVQLKLRK